MALGLSHPLDFLIRSLGDCGFDILGILGGGSKYQLYHLTLSAGRDVKVFIRLTIVPKR
jgi:hypothetical protein